MQTDYYNTFIPIEVGDIIQPKGYINIYEVDDILVCHSAKTKETKIILKLIDRHYDNNLNIVSSFNYTDHEWVIVKTNKEIKNENRENV